MGRRKLSRIRKFDDAKARLAALKSIDVNLDLGNGITVAGYQTVCDNFDANLSDYNKTLSTIDDMYNKTISALDVVVDMSDRVLTGVASKYGKNSSEYEMAGGTRRSERKKPVSKKKAATAA